MFQHRDDRLSGNHDISNTDDLESAEGGEIVVDEVADPTDDSDLQDPLERLAESEAAEVTDDSDAQDSTEGLEPSDEDVATADDASLDGKLAGAGDRGVPRMKAAMKCSRRS